MFITVDIDGSQQSLKLSPDLESSIAAFLSEHPAYPDAAALIFSNLRDGLFTALLGMHPPQTVVDAKVALDAATLTYEDAKAAVLADSKGDVKAGIAEAGAAITK